MPPVAVTPGLGDAPLPIGTDEELAGPPRRATPVERAERISSLDILRGFALLGILMLNIDDFGLPLTLHDYPSGIPKPAFVGPHAHLNLVLLFIKWIFFEGKMRGLFSMLFGAGVVLLTGRAERRGAGDRAGDIYLRRSLWLVGLGMLHGMYLWDGDILFEYGFNGVFFLYPFRIMKPKGLFLTGIGALALYMFTLSNVLNLTKFLQIQHQIGAIHAAQQAGKQLTPPQQQTLRQWTALETAHNPRNRVAEEMASAQGGYKTYHQEHGGLIFAMNHAKVYAIGASLGTLSLMLIGIALFKNGFLRGELSCTTYLWTAAAGFLISVPITVIGLFKTYASDGDFMVFESWLHVGFAPAQLAGTLAMTSLLLLLIKSGILRSWLRPFAAVGQTALSNYLLTTVICQFLFIWGPWKLYGKLEYYQMLYVVAGVWAVNLIVSPLWLRRFQFGPLEWLWRSLTYWKLQPLLLCD